MPRARPGWYDPLPEVTAISNDAEPEGARLATERSLGATDVAAMDLVEVQIVRGERHGGPSLNGVNMPDAFQTLAFPTRDAFETWLARHHAASPGVWLKLAKKGAEVPSITYVEALDIALCHGWIDGQKRSLDARFWLQRFTPRSPRSRWSKINCGKAEALIAAGRMRPAGQLQVDRAKADGRWSAAYAGSRTITVPDDLAVALAANPQAAAFFATLDRSNRYAVLYRVHEVKRPETRARRIAQFVAMLAEGRTIHG